ncbi:DUF4878 domain-containing protein [Gemella sanguinis]
MENQDNNIKNDNNISNDLQLSEASNNQQHNKKPKLNKKTITIVLTLLVVLIAGIFFFIRSSNAYGEKTPEEAVQGFLEAVNTDNYEKASDYVYFENNDARKKVKKGLKDKEDKQGVIYSYHYKIYKKLKILSIDERGDEARVTLEYEDGDREKVLIRGILMKKVDNRWYCYII